MTLRRPAMMAALFCASVLLLSGSRQNVDDDFFAIQKNFEIFGSLYETLVGSYVDPVRADMLMRSGISAMLEELDPYTVFLDEATLTDANVQRAHRLGTVGLDIDFRDGRLTVLSPTEGGAAFRQGIRVGDVILEVDGRSVDDLTRGDVLFLLSGEPGSLVRVAIERAGEETRREFSLVRQVFRVDPVAHVGFVPGESGGTTAYVHLVNFNPGSGNRVRDELERLNRGTPLTAVVLDLRDNQGGLLDEAVSIVQLFVPAGSPVVSTRGRRPDTAAEYRTSRAPTFPEVQLFVLVNGRSASASEIVAGAMQDLDRGVIVGETSFGKGLAQNVHSLPFNTGLKITTSRFYGPSGRNVQSIDYRMRGAVVPDSVRGTFTTTNGRVVRGGGGIEPDVRVSDGEPGPLESALRQGGWFFRYANERASPAATPATSFSPGDIDIGDFESWLGNRGFDFRTEADEHLDALGQSLASSPAARDALRSIRSVVAAEKEQAFAREADAIRRILFETFADRFVAEPDQLYDMKLPHDPVMVEVMRLVSDGSAYRALLRP